MLVSSGALEKMSSRTSSFLEQAHQLVSRWKTMGPLFSAAANLLERLLAGEGVKIEERNYVMACISFEFQHSTERLDPNSHRDHNPEFVRRHKGRQRGNHDEFYVCSDGEEFFIHWIAKGCRRPGDKLWYLKIDDPNNCISCSCCSRVLLPEICISDRSFLLQLLHRWTEEKEIDIFKQRAGNKIWELFRRDYKCNERHKRSFSRRLCELRVARKAPPDEGTGEQVEDDSIDYSSSSFLDSSSSVWDGGKDHSPEIGLDPALLEDQSGPTVTAYPTGGMKRSMTCVPGSNPPCKRGCSEAKPGDAGPPFYHPVDCPHPAPNVPMGFCNPPSLPVVGARWPPVFSENTEAICSNEYFSCYPVCLEGGDKVFNAIEAAAYSL